MSFIYKKILNKRKITVRFFQKVHESLDCFARARNDECYAGNDSNSGSAAGSGTSFVLMVQIAAHANNAQKIK
jgi:hypothetical protein